MKNVDIFLFDDFYLSRLKNPQLSTFLLQRTINSKQTSLGIHKWHRLRCCPGPLLCRHVRSYVRKCTVDQKVCLVRRLCLNAHQCSRCSHECLWCFSLDTPCTQGSIVLPFYHFASCVPLARAPDSDLQLRKQPTLAWSAAHPATASRLSLEAELAVCFPYIVEEEGWRGYRGSTCEWGM